MTATTLAGHNRVSALIDDLATKGWSHQADFLPADIQQALLADFAALKAAEELTPAGVGREEDYTLRSDIRRARTTWMDGQSGAQKAFLAWTSELRLTLNRELFLGLFEIEASYAFYPVGGFYDRHLDSFKGARNRVVSLVVYLNDGWQTTDGGALAIYDPSAPDNAEPVARVLPVGRDVVFMLSEDIPHAVEPTNRERVAIAAWWRVNQSSPDRVDPLN